MGVVGQSGLLGEWPRQHGVELFEHGEVARHEAYLMKRVSKLLDVRAGFLSEARKRVEGKE